MAHLVAPSLLSANFLQLEAEVRMVNASEADWLHLDIMDGLFVPNLSFGFPVVEQVRTVTEKPLDVHLMITDPDRYIERFRQAGADSITVHYEACIHLHRTVQQIRAAGARAGVALNPHTPVLLLQDIIADLDLVLIMSVNPGFGGQKFIPRTYEKLKELKVLITRNASHALVEVDGGVGPTNARALLEAGADVLVAGNSIFGSPDPVKTITLLKQS